MDGTRQPVLSTPILSALELHATDTTPGYKRPFDVVLGFILLAAAAPMFGVVALAVRLTSSGPVLFRQERLGKWGRPFTLYKFRTMYHGVDAAAHREYFKQYLRGATAPGQEQPVFKLWNDPRITPVGGVLRRLALDELPQLINVLKGDMSLVGPRPPLAYEVEHYSTRHLRRLTVKPGITGLWQVHGRDVVDFEDMVTMDLEYIDRQSFQLDLVLLCATGPALVWAYAAQRWAQFRSTKNGQNGQKG